MSLESIRWKVTQAVRRGLLGTKPNGFARRIYDAARKLPLVHGLWRRLDKDGTNNWLDTNNYVRAGGIFASDPPASFEALPTDATSEAFFSNLIQRIRTYEPPLQAAQGRIVLINNGLSAGGAERQIKYTLTGLAARKKDIRFLGEYLGIAAGLDFHLASVLKAGVDARAPRILKRPLRQTYAAVSRPVADALCKLPPGMTMEVLAMVDELRAIRPSVVHLWQDETSIKHAISALIAGVPRIVLSGRNLNPTYFSFHQPLMHGAYRALVEADAAVLSNNSHAGAASYGEWLGIDAAKIQVVHNGVDTSHWPAPSPADAAAWRASRKIEATDTLVLGAFRLSPEKRPLLWLQVAAAVIATRPDIKFAIAGDGPMRPQVEAEIERLSLQSHVLLLGEIPQVALPMAAADAMMLLSAQEGLPNVLLEAQWYGLPCLITDAGGAREAISDGVTGVVSYEDTPAALASLLLKMLNDQLLRVSARAEGPSLLQNRFGMKRMLDETWQLYAID